MLDQRYRFAEHEEAGAEIGSEIGYILFVDQAETARVRFWIQRYVHHH